MNVVIHIQSVGKYGFYDNDSCYGRLHLDARVVRLGA